MYHEQTDYIMYKAWETDSVHACLSIVRVSVIQTQLFHANKAACQYFFCHVYSLPHVCRCTVILWLQIQLLSCDMKNTKEKRKTVAMLVYQGIVSS